MGTIPLGSVLVYGGKGAGHVELRTAKGFVSDFASAMTYLPGAISRSGKPLSGGRGTPFIS